MNWRNAADAGDASKSECSRPNKVVAVGEALWDLLPAGPVLGGAPVNFAIHAHEFGAAATLISKVGNDARGRAVVAQLQAAGLSAELVGIDSHRSTGTTTVEIDGHGEPRYAISKPAAWDAIVASPEALAAVAEANAVCFGTLAQRSVATRTAIQLLLARTRKSALCVFDVNLRHPFYSSAIVKASLGMAKVVKLNEEELNVFVRWFNLRGETLDQLTELAVRFSLDIVALTRGPRGSLILAQGEACEHPGVPIEVRDTVGAGDAFTAALVMGLLHGWPLAKISQIANETAAHVCTQRGATPSLLAALRVDFAENSSESGQVPR